jgi:tetratricopeptide (TPR) repeat protein
MRSDEAQTSQYLQQAVEAFHKALEVYTDSAFPAQWAIVTGNLANAYEARKDWENTYKCYAQLLNHDPTNERFQAKLKELSDKR